MNKFIYISLFFLFILSCTGYKNTSSSANQPITSEEKLNQSVADTVKIANDELEYEIIIIDPGFTSWIAGTARPRGYYTESYLESRNNLYVTEWNFRASQPLIYDANLYQMRIDYDRNIHYGYEVNYMMYNYFIYFQIKYNQRLAGFVPRP